MAALLRVYYQAYSGLPRLQWLLALLIFANRCGTMVLPFLALYLKERKGLEPSVAVQFLSVYGAGGIVGAYLGGRLTTRFGAVRVIPLSLVLAAPGYACIPLWDSQWAIAANLLYLSIVAETIRPAIATATGEYSPPHLLARAFALNRLAMNLGMSIGPAIGGVLAARGAWFLLFSVNGAAALVTAVVALLSFDVREPTHAVSVDEPRGAGSPWSDGPLLAFLVLQVCGAVVFFQVICTLPVYLSEQYRLAPDRIGLLFVLNTALIVLCEMVLTDRLHHRPPLRIVSVGTSLVCLGFGGAVFGQGFAFAAALTVVWTLGEMLTAPFGITYVARRAAGRDRGAYMGLNSVSHALAFVGAPLIGGLLYRVDPQLPWWCCLGMAVLLPIGYRRLEQYASEPR